MAHLKLDMEVYKSHMSKQHVCVIALSIIDNRYSKDSWLHVFTDGSIFNDEEDAGADVYCELFSCYAPIGAQSALYDGEIEGVYITLKQLSIHLSSFHQVVIFSDSLSALESIANKQHSDNIHILQCRDLARSIPVSFQWIPAYCVIIRNEAADFLAKKGARVLLRPLKNLSFHSVKLLIKRSHVARIKQKALRDSASKLWVTLT